MICRRPAIRAAISTPMAGEGPPAVSQCLVSGLTTRIARLHPSIQGVAGAPSTGATIVTFNYPAFKSYGLLQGQNAPVGVYAAFAYTTALNKLLRYNSTSVTRAGTTTVVFWAGQETANEAVLCNLMSSMAGDEPWRDGVTIADLYAAPQPGVPPPVEDTTPFFILALSAESGRLTMRFFHQDTVAGMARSLVRWFDELTIAPIMPPLSLAGLLCGISIQGDIKNAPPLLGSELLRSAYTGMPLPHQLLAEALVRSAVEQGPTHERVSLLKSYLMRNYGRNITVALDPDDIDPSYRLGRLFAVLENLQKTAVNTNRTIRDSYWSAASSMPATIFPHLLDLAVVHLMKIKQNRIALALWFERRIGEIAAALPTSLPTLMTLEMQGRFAIGYWHQRYVPRPERLTAEEPAIEPAVEVP